MNKGRRPHEGYSTSPDGCEHQVQRRVKHRNIDEDNVQIHAAFL